MHNLVIVLKVANMVLWSAVVVLGATLYMMDNKKMGKKVTGWLA